MYLSVLKHLMLEAPQLFIMVVWMKFWMYFNNTCLHNLLLLLKFAQNWTRTWTSPLSVEQPILTLIIDGKLEVPSTQLCRRLLVIYYTSLLHLWHPSRSLVLVEGY